MSIAKKNIYADNAATTKLDPLALDAMLPFLQDNFGNPSGLYSLSRSAKKAIEDARLLIAECIGALPEEIYFTSGGSESDNWAIKGVGGLKSTSKYHIVTTAIEHHAVLNACKKLAKQGAKITYLIPDTKGHISPQMLAASIRPDTICISIMLANNEIGTIEDIPALSKLAKEYKILFHTDAVQAMGHIPVNVHSLGTDILSASAHKFNGPKGTGFLFIRNGVPIRNFIDGGQQEHGHRAGTENVSGIVGMAVALKNNCMRMEQSANRLRRMENIFINSILQSLPSAIFNGDTARKLPGHVSLSLPGISSESLLHVLDLKGIAISTGAACDSQSVRISHVLKAIGLSESLANGTIRITFGSNNTEEDPIAIANEIITYYNKVTSQNSKLNGCGYE
ncbi:MAG: cysteine desulfurase family protein [Victivallaceae bacterium]